MDMNVNSCLTMFRCWKDHPWSFPFCVSDVSERFFFTSFEKNVDFFGAEWKSTYSGTPISQSRKTPLTEIFMFPKTSRNPSNWNQHLRGNSKSETKKTPSHLITKTPWTIIPWILEPGRFFCWYRRQRTQLLRLLLVTLFAKCNLLALEVSARTKPFEVGIFSNTIKKKRLTLQCARLLRQVVTWSHQRLLSKKRATFSSKSEIKCVKFDFHWVRVRV